MPLHVNLYHEIQQQDLARRRDPVRLAVLGILVLTIGLVVNYFIALEQSHLLAGRYTALEDDWTKIQPQAQTAKTREDELNANLAVSNAVTKSVDNRVFMAPLLDDLLKSMPKTVQVTHMQVDGPADLTGTAAALSVVGVASAVEPRKEAEAVRKALDTKLSTEFKHVTSSFKGLDDGDQFVMLDGKQLATAIFSIEFQIQVRDAVATPPPAAAPARKVKVDTGE